MVIVLRDDPAERTPEEGFAWAEGHLLAHGGRRRTSRGTSVPGPLAGLARERPGVPPTPLQAAGGQAIIPLQKGRLVLTEAAGRVPVTRA